jgi:hypothetical protein
MAEDQGVNGTIWNKEATALFSLFGWETIGDHDMDVVGEDEKDYGLDSVIKFTTPLKANPQSVILEAKRYKTENFNVTKLQSWIDRLDKKLVELRNSDKFIKQFPILQECSSLDIGIIAIWFHDIENYSQFHPKFIDMLQKVKTSNKTRKTGYNRIFVIDNSIILKLCSLYNAIKERQADNSCEMNFYYPPILIDEAPIFRSKTLIIEYVISKIILAETKDKKESLVFYFGELETDYFKQLRSLLSKCSFMDKEKAIKLFIYKSHDDFRKIEPDVKKLFSDVTFEIKSMDNLHDLPAYLKNITHE